MTSKKEIQVYAYWGGFNDPVLMGMLTVTPAKGKEVFSFAYTKEWLQSGFTYMIDPDLQLYPGSYYPKDEKSNFGAFLDSCPDRWGRVLMERREAALARKEMRETRHLLESDFLLGVYDAHRMGGLRFKTDEAGNFLNDDRHMAAPPFTSLRELEQASMNFEKDNVDDKDYLKWINLLIAPGSSLGGARPKASVSDPEGHLYIAKFPSIKDDRDIGAWEMVLYRLGTDAGVNMASGNIKQFNNSYHTYLTKRFDRTERGRVHFASALTLLGYSDGAGHDTGESYLDLAEFIMQQGADVKTDLEELWRRIVFYICVKNTDDHLRNHGFLLTDRGWRLSPAFDVNPNEYGNGLSLNISDKDNSLDLGLALAVAQYFRVDDKTANTIIAQVKQSVAKWRTVARHYGISKAEQDRMGKAFDTA
jgi:serine/threonine-protein kinase HipA